MRDSDFVPRWASPPGDTIKDALREKALNLDALSEGLGLSDEKVRALISGANPLTINVADQLTSILGGTVEFWMTRDSQYRADIARMDADDWAQHLPVNEMSAYGWLPNPIDGWITQINECMRFFDVTNLPDWQEQQTALQNRTRFRSSRALEADSYAVAAWLRQSEVELSRIECGPWDRKAFTTLLPDLLPLTRIPDPQDFIPRLSKRCAEVGVAVGVVRAPRRCPISGAARRLSNGLPSITLTGRHRADDHLWFTFYHEAAHLVLHDDEVLYLDEIEQDADPTPSADEIEADQFAGEILVPVNYEAAVAAARRSPFELRRLAREIGVSTGIVVGHLQHRGVLGYSSRLNRLKRRYKWDGPNLERA